MVVALRDCRKITYTYCPAGPFYLQNLQLSELIRVPGQRRCVQTDCIPRFSGPQLGTLMEFPLRAALERVERGARCRDVVTLVYVSDITVDSLRENPLHSHMHRVGRGGAIQAIR